MATVKLTTKAIKAFRYEGDGKSRDVRWASDLSSFGLRIYPSGKKAFVVAYRAKGRSRLYVLGPFGKLTLHQNVPGSSPGAATNKIKGLAKGR